VPSKFSLHHWICLRDHRNSIAFYINTNLLYHPTHGIKFFHVAICVSPSYFYVHPIPMAYRVAAAINDTMEQVQEHRHHHCYRCHGEVMPCIGNNRMDITSSS
jgi:hypothetical protein